MLLVIDLFIIICLVIVAIQDVKQRQISWVLIPLILSGFIYKAMNGTILLTEILLNIAFVSIQLLALTLYMSIKNKKPVNIVNTYLGLGDILFFLVICAAFSFVNFIAFYLLSLVLTLIGVIVYNYFSGKQTQAIPLAGVQAISLIFLMLTAKIIAGVDFYNDGYLLSIITP